MVARMLQPKIRELAEWLVRAGPSIWLVVLDKILLIPITLLQLEMGEDHRGVAPEAPEAQVYKDQMLRGLMALDLVEAEEEDTQILALPERGRLD